MIVGLIHPPHPEAIEDKLDAPLGLLYIAASINGGNSVWINDLSGKTPDGWKIDHADVYGITAYAPSISTVKKIIAKCKEVNPKAKIVLGGAHPTAMPVSSLYEGVDSIVIGEGEVAFNILLGDYPNLQKFYKYELNRNLDVYPNPAYRLVDLSTYKRTIGGEHSVTLLTSRGCPYRCYFCGLPEHHKTIKTRSPESVVREVAYLKDTYGIKAFNFQDDTFTFGKQRLRKLLRLLKPLNIKFRCHGRAGNDKREDYFLLKEAGCELIAWGIESGSQKMLDLMNKKVTVQDNLNVISWAKEAGITSRAFLIFGFPGETPDTIEETKQFITQANVDQFFCSNFCPYPGTAVWANPSSFGITHMNHNFDNYYQVDKTGYGGQVIETKWLNYAEFKKLEIEFRSWLKKRKLKGPLLEYEKEMEK